MSSISTATPFDPSVRTPRELLSVYGAVMNELKRRKIIRTANNPAADYAEWLVAKHLELTLSTKSNTGHDATDAEGNRYEIKCRRLSPSNGSGQLSPFRGLAENHFDFLVGVLFNSSFRVEKACIVPWQTVRDLATHRKHVNGHVLFLRDALWKAPNVEDITLDLQMAQLAADDQEKPVTP